MDIETAAADSPIVCTLTNSDAAAQALEWVDLQHRATIVGVTCGAELGAAAVIGGAGLD